MANAKGNPENLKPVRSKDEARKRGAEGGKKSGAARRKKRDAKSAISLLLNMAAQGSLEKNLKSLGFDEEDWTNMNALMASMFTDAIGGDNTARKLLLDYGGFHPDQKMREEESKARISAIEAQAADAGSFGDGLDEEITEDVHIYLPEKDSEEGS